MDTFYCDACVGKHCQLGRGLTDDVEEALEVGSELDDASVLDDASDDDEDDGYGTPTRSD